MSQNLTRRNVLVGTAAVAAVAIGGAAWMSEFEFKSSLLTFFRQSLPGVPIDQESASTCIDDFVADWPLPKTLVLRAAWSTAGVANMASAIDRFESPARHLLTSFLINSNFFHVDDPRAQPIVYVTPPPHAPCGNPFANLDPP
jgi:hypothetical protein